ncbi:MAG: hypothetical protein H6591_13860 [Flavobacteriales bacterium]|nr:hypothetical protein [Flavobacteriales bacterium]
MSMPLSLRHLLCACCTAFALWPCANAQIGAYPVALGPAPIGYMDTVIVVAGQRYEQFGYSGPAPLFIGIWHPLSNASVHRTPLTWRELRERTLSGPLRKTYDELLLRMDSSLVEYDIRYPINSDEPLDYGPGGPSAVKEAMLDLPTRCVRAPVEGKSTHPVIVYHHGSQGLSDENLWMAEYFVSRGYVFITSNFHWPLEHAMYGTPLAWRPDAASVSTMIDLARSLSTTDSVFYIGHSWGAQEGWCLLHEQGLAQAFVSLETTLEWKTDTMEIKDKWPHVHEALRTKRYPMPILMVADTENGPPFAPFTAARGRITQADPVLDFDHESYTSAYLMRHVLNERFPQPDSATMESQLSIYRAMLALIDDWFATVRHHAPFPAESSSRTFQIVPTP